MSRSGRSNTVSPAAVQKSGSRLDQLFAKSAKRHPGREAILHRGQTISYEELDQLSNRIARYLQRSAGVGRNTLVGLCLPRSPRLIATMLGVLKAGGAYLPLDSAYPTARLEFIIADSSAPLVLVQGEVDRFAGSDARVCDLDLIWDEIEAESPDAVRSDAAASDMAYVIYTSGSTGVPKGVILSHSAAGLVRWFEDSLDPRDIARVAASTSIAFDPSIIEIFCTLCTGGLVILKEDVLEPFTEGEAPTMLAAPPSILDELARLGAIPNSVRIINVGGEAVTGALVERLYAASRAERIYNHYGPTEATTCTTVALVERGSPEEPTIGRPIAGARVYVLGEDGSQLPSGETGEIHIAGPTIALGYIGDEEATEASFLPDPFHRGQRMYRTGDLGQISPDGDLVFRGRVDDQVKLRGFRIELGEVETAIKRLPDVRQAAASIRSDGSGRDRLIVYASAARSLSLRDVRRELSTSLPRHMLPSELLQLDALPLGPTGKVDRKALAALSDRPRDRSDPEPRFDDDFERIIAGIFAEHLGTSVFGPEDDFFEQGGDSLLAISVAINLEEVLGEIVPPTVVNQASTPRALASALAALRLDYSSVLVPISSAPGGSAIYCAPDLDGRPTSFWSLARSLAPMHTMVGLSPGPFLAELIARPDLSRLSRIYFDAIRSVQPDGPYVVCGFSLGAVQAFSLARTIEDAGERVLLVLIDGPNPAASRSLAHNLRWTFRELPKAVARDGFGRFVTGFARSRSWARLWGNLWRLVRADKVPEFVTPSNRAVAGGLLKATFGYAPTAFGGTSLLIRCTSPDRRLTFWDTDGELGWSALHGDDFRVERVEGAHMQIMRAPSVASVRDMIQAEIERFLDLGEAEGAGGVAKAALDG